jgi:hypothetical protein
MACIVAIESVGRMDFISLGVLQRNCKKIQYCVNQQFPGALMKTDFRQTYQPEVNRQPAWLRRFWAWF